MSWPRPTGSAAWPATPSLQEREFALAKDGYQAVKHQSFVGTGYFDAVQNVVTSNQTSTAALVGSTEEAQF